MWRSSGKFEQRWNRKLIAIDSFHSQALEHQNIIFFEYIHLPESAVYIPAWVLCDLYCITHLKASLSMLRLWRPLKTLWWRSANEPMSQQRAEFVFAAVKRAVWQPKIPLACGRNVSKPIPLRSVHLKSVRNDTMDVFRCILNVQDPFWGVAWILGSQHALGTPQKTLTLRDYHSF